MIILENVDVVVDDRGEHEHDGSGDWQSAVTTVSTYHQHRTTHTIHINVVIVSMATRSNRHRWHCLCRH